jgi:hypothetical protein
MWTYDFRIVTGRRFVIRETTITYESDGGGGEQHTPDLHLVVMSPQILFSKELPASGIVTIGRSSRCEAQIDDPLSSREHARIHIVRRHGPPSLLVEDVGSANGTLVRDTPILRGHRVPISPGDTVTIGSTVIMIEKGLPPVSVRRICSRSYFETRAAQECARAVGANASVAVARIRFNHGPPWTSVLPMIARCLPSPHVFAACGPRDYDALLVDLDTDEAARLMAELIDACGRSGLEGVVAVAHYPKDGRTLDALLARLDTITAPAREMPDAQVRPASATDPRSSPAVRGNVDDDTAGT